MAVGKGKPGRPPGPVPPHGTRQRYQLRREPCRCVACRLANTAYVRRVRGIEPSDPGERPITHRASKGAGEPGVTWSEPSLFGDAKP